MENVFFTTAKITVILTVFFLFPLGLYAKTDVSLSETDITFSKDNILEGDTVTIYARVFNLGDSDVQGYVDFLNNQKEIAPPQPISLKPNTYDDVFVNWKPVAGNYSIEAKIVGLNPVDTNGENDSTVKKNVLVDTDTDHDNIGDQKDPDIDGDQLPNNQEAVLGTNPKKPDTDGDTINDNLDSFPKDPAEWQDTDGDKVGDNSDPNINSNDLPNQNETPGYAANTDAPASNVLENISGAFSLDFSKLTKQVPLKENINWNHLGLGLAIAALVLFLLRKKKK